MDIPSCTPDTAVVLDHDVSEDTVIPPGCYRAPGLDVHGGATLTIQGGATILFEQGTSLWVSSDGVLSAVGTEDASVVLSAVEAIRGGWDGVSVHGSTSQDNRLEYAIVEYGGGGNGDDWGVGAAGVALRADPGQLSSLSMRYTTIRNSASWGFAAAGSAVIGAFDHNQITSNAKCAATLYLPTVHLMDSTTQYQGNDDDCVDVQYGSLDEDGTWPALDVPYRPGSIEVKAHWTIAAGASLEFKAGARVTVHQEGRLTAAGSATAPILFTSVEALPGTWCGIDFLDSLGTENQLGHVTIEYGGGCGNDWGGSANLMLSGVPGAVGSRVVLHDSQIRHSDAFGVYAVGSGQLPEFANNVITENADAPVRVKPDDVHFLDAGSTYTGNGDDVIWVSDGDVSEDQSWAALDVPYDLSDTGVGAHLTLMPGVTLLFDTGRGMTVFSDGALTAEGTAADPILLTGVEALSGSWCGLEFVDSLSVDNKLTQVTVEYGGGCGHDWGGRANVTLSSVPGNTGSVVAIHGSTIQHSASWGVWVSRSGQINADVETDNTFTDNIDGVIYHD